MKLYERGNIVPSVHGMDDTTQPPAVGDIGQAQDFGHGNATTIIRALDPEKSRPKREETARLCLELGRIRPKRAIHSRYYQVYLLL